MRAWLLLLAVLATFQPIVQVASTEDTSSRFITTILPQRTKQSTINSTTTKSIFEQMIDNSSKSKSKSKSKSQSSLTTTHTHDTVSSTLLHKNSNNYNKNNNKNSLNNSLNNNNNNNNSDSDSDIVSESKQKRYSDIKYTKNTKTNNFKNTEQKIENEIVKSSEVTTATVATETNRTEKEQTTVRSNNTKDTNTDTTILVHNITTNNNSNNNNYNKNKSNKENPKMVVAANATATSTSTATATSTSTSTATATNALAQHKDEQRTQKAHKHSDGSWTNLQEGELASEAISAELDDDNSYSNKEILSDKVKPDPKILVEIESSLLSLFNMKRPPKIDRSKIIIPDAMKELYEQIMGHDYDSVNIPKRGLLTQSANTVRSFTHQESKIDDRFPHHHRFRLKFDVKSIPAEEKLKAAELQLSRDAISQVTPNARANRTRYQVLVYDITEVGIRNKREPSYLLLDNKTVRLNSTDTINLDVQPAVDRWLASPKKNYGLLIEVRTMRSLKPAPQHHVRLRRSADEPLDNWQRKQPILFTYTDDERHKSRSIRDVSTRSKRAGYHRRPHRRKNHEENCRRHSLYVDFADVGWSNWIVAPPGYDAFFCHGKCPFPLADHYNTTNHAVVQTLVNNINPGKVPKPCCVPTQLEGISMLYLNDQNTVVLKNYQDMTAVGCGCR